MFNPTKMRTQAKHLASMTDDELFAVYVKRLRCNNNRRVKQGRQPVPMDRAPVVAPPIQVAPVVKKTLPPYEFFKDFPDL